MSRKNNEPCEGFDDWVDNIRQLREIGFDGKVMFEVPVPEGNYKKGGVTLMPILVNFWVYVKAARVRKAGGGACLEMDVYESGDGAINYSELCEVLSQATAGGRWALDSVVLRQFGKWRKGEFALYDVTKIVRRNHENVFYTSLYPNTKVYAQQQMTPSDDWYVNHGRKVLELPEEPCGNWKDWLYAAIGYRFYSDQRAVIRLYVPEENMASQEVRLPDGRTGRYLVRPWRGVGRVTFDVCPVWLELSEDLRTLRMGVVGLESADSVPKSSEDQPMKWSEFLPQLISMCMEYHDNTITGVQLVSGAESGWDKWYDVQFLAWVENGPYGFRFVTKLNKRMSRDKNAASQMVPDLKFYEKSGTFDAKLDESAEIKALAGMLDDCRLD